MYPSQTQTTLMSQRLLSVEILHGGLINEAAVFCSVKILDLALRELKKESFKTKITKKGKTFTFSGKVRRRHLRQVNKCVLFLLLHLLLRAAVSVKSHPPLLETVCAQTSKFVLGSTYNLSRASYLPTLELAFVSAPSMPSMNSSKQLGSVRIPLESIDQGTHEQDHEYTLHVDGQPSSDISGTLRIKLQWNMDLPQEGIGGEAMSPAEEIFEDDTEEEPNELHVSILRARNLLVMDKALVGEGSSDPRVVVSVGKETRKTETMQKNLHPVWLERFVFQTERHEDAITITVEDVDLEG